MHKKSFLRLFASSFIVCALLNPHASAANPEESETYTVTGIENDSRDSYLVLSDGRRVRLFGVIVPKPNESFGKEASEFLNKEIKNRKVKLTYDWKDKDGYGNTVAYVWRAPDGWFLNGEIVRQGYGLAVTRHIYKYQDKFMKAEKEAAQTNVGLWKVAPGDSLNSTESITNELNKREQAKPRRHVYRHTPRSQPENVSSIYELNQKYDSKTVEDHLSELVKYHTEKGKGNFGVSTPFNQTFNEDEWELLNKTAQEQARPKIRQHFASRWTGVDPRRAKTVVSQKQESKVPMVDYIAISSLKRENAKSDIARQRRQVEDMYQHQVKTAYWKYPQYALSPDMEQNKRHDLSYSNSLTALKRDAEVQAAEKNKKKSLAVLKKQAKRMGL